METRLVSDPSTRRQYENKLAQHEDTIQSLKTDMVALSAEINKDELFIGATNDLEGGGNATTDGDALLGEASKLQDKTSDSLGNTKRMIEESKNVGMETMEELRRQRDQLNTIDEEAMKIEDNLVRADRLIKTFGRRMATDKFIQCFAVVNVLLLVGVVIYSSIKKGAFSNDDSKDDLPSPVRMLRAFIGISEEILFENPN
uniref:t-SNARE coiled-coil homology domain-containing protein n=1 Tax=Proboscia inermis TaxID=420281 RepID=A0A7S0G6V6_9STRA|mmetsp:Transcript_13020/g.13156  ORF Transcript_13020/g.13156 Transcript_13020/m.13156 type:complete len:201 (+) Transcript_13020:289-891(+)|eukprot:CAMPEP_0171322162 /NCGR_PEP_ID=MMETSP0816-20121228/114785_1 /TAXON_ID=420281 /ORGANISM="Proboscia inermis, Strain CCAP1064/1" /LENGTH=200 /DNA_ID=CAMNT_0011820569 /DNA_START=256 /DNA_END=858 /DNA_ORIENTATION=-